MAQTLGEFFHSSQRQRPNVQAFEAENGRTLELNLGIPGGSGQMMSWVWIKNGSMVAYRGEVGFVRQGIMDQGFGTMVKKALTDEGMTLTKASSKSRAQLYVADGAKRVTILRLTGDSIIVNGNDLLAFEPTISHKITMMKKASSIMSGGWFNVKLSGHGFIAILSEGEPITLVVARGHPPVFTDPQATVAWSGDLTPDFKTDVQFKTLFGRGSGESFQMKFDGSKGPSGFVIVQPYEEVAPPRRASEVF